MIYAFGPEVPFPDQEIIRRALDRFEPHWVVRVWRPEPGRYTLWFGRGWSTQEVTLVYLATLRTDTGPLDKHQEDILAEGYRAVKCYQANQEQHPFEAEPITQETMDRIRRSDFERVYLEGELQERLDKGLLPGLEHLRDVPVIRPVRTRPERLAHDKGMR